MRIIITGGPATGKSTIAKKLAEKLKLELIDIKKIVGQKGLSKGAGHEVDIRELKIALGFLKHKRNYLVEGHLACELKLPADFIFVLRTHPAVLRKRMKRRGYQKKKLEENLMAEMLDYCVQRTEIEYGKKPLELDTSAITAEQAARRMSAAIKQKKKKLDSVDYSKELKAYLRLGRPS